jgi:hypothetical protein
MTTAGSSEHAAKLVFEKFTRCPQCGRKDGLVCGGSHVVEVGSEDRVVDKLCGHCGHTWRIYRS